MNTINQDHQHLSAVDLREAMRFWGSGVAIAAAAHQGIRHGMTVSSFTSLSLDPPLVMVSLEQTARTHQIVTDSQAFGLTILAAGQEEISNRFAGRETEQQDRFADLDSYTLTTGSPLLTNGLASLDCRVTAAYPVGTHTLFIGEVVAARASQGKLPLPLLYFNRAYRHLVQLGISK